MADASSYKTRHEAVAKEISGIVAKGVPVIEAILLYGENHNLTPEEVGAIVKNDPLLLQRVTDEALVNNMLKDVEREQTLGEFFE